MSFSVGLESLQRFGFTANNKANRETTPSNASRHNSLPPFLTHLINNSIKTALDIYYTSPHRRSPHPVERPTRPDATIRFNPGMLNFQPSERYIHEFYRHNIDFIICNPVGELEGDYLAQWPEKTGQLLRRSALSLLPQEESLIVYMGHSAGAFTTCVQGGLAKKAIGKGNIDRRFANEVRNLRHIFPELDNETVSDEQIFDLAASWQSAVYTGLGGPLNGIPLNKTGAFLNRKIVTPHLPHLFGSMTKKYLERVYEMLAIHPSTALDIVAYSDSTPLYPHHGRRSLITGALMQWSLKSAAPFLDYEGRHDGMVPVEAALIEGVEILLRLNEDHLRMVEFEEPARQVIGEIKKLAASRPRRGD